MRSLVDQRGFTLLELVVVMGILSGFLLMLVQFLDSGVQLFSEGENGQALADRAEAARTAVDRELRSLRGPGLDFEDGKQSERLLAQMLPLGLPQRSEPGAPQGLVLRAAVQLSPQHEERIRHDAMLLRAITELGPKVSTDELAARARELERKLPLRGTGRLLLLPWPKTADQSILELRIARFLPDQLVQIGEGDAIDPFSVMVPGGPEWPALALFTSTEVLVDDVLHFELRFWSQNTQSFDDNGDKGPERVWDSARAGWLSDTAMPPVFRLDRDPQSLDNPTDDVYPHAIRVIIVVASDERQTPDGLLARELEVDAQSLLLLNGERFPGATDGGFVKVEGEWLRYAQRIGDELTGLHRGQRGTRAVMHAPAARCRVGRTVEFTVSLAHAKDNWNG
ncbi:MAG: type II secretion system protein [Planctomycetota bacterium]|jgi:prepilin-type N-terminal cleavage/methylation domain-containing protein